MRKYFIHTGAQQLGPFSKEDLIKKKIQNNTLIWYEGLDEWTSADEVHELKEVLAITAANETKEPAEIITKPERISDPFMLLLLILLLLGITSALLLKLPHLY